LTDYNSDNTRRLNEAEMAAVLLGLEYVRREMAAWQPAEAAPV
jgi:hypothetical protein